MIQLQAHQIAGHLVKTMISEAGPAVLLAKAVGALAGSLISLAYVLPRGRREAMLRLAVGAVSGLVFGTTAGVKIADMLDVLDRISVTEVSLMGAALTSACAWWGLGALQRVVERVPSTNLSAGIAKSMRMADENKASKRQDK